MTINNIQNSQQSVAPTIGNNGSASPSIPMPKMQSDSEIISKVASVTIKPSQVNEVTQPTREVVAKAAQQLQEFVQKMGRNLSFSVDETTGYNVVRVVNPDTGELVRQLPSEELLKIARDFERLNSVLVSQRA